MRAARTFTFAITLAAVPATALAQDAQASDRGPAAGPPADRPLNIEVGAGGVVYPSFPGASRFKVLPVPLLKITYKQAAFVSFPDLLRVDLVKVAGAHSALSAGPLVGLRFGRKVKDDRSYLAGLADRGDTVEVGGYVAVALTPSFSARTDVGQAVSGNQGLRATASLDWTRLVGPAILSIGPTATFANDRYVRAYYGVTPVEAARSSFIAYRPSGGLERAGANATFVLPLGRRWSAVATGSYARLVGDASHSPIARGRDGSRDQFVGALFFTYRLK